MNRNGPKWTEMEGPKWRHNEPKWTEMEILWTKLHQNKAVMDRNGPINARNWQITGPIFSQFLSHFIFENNETSIEKLNKILNPDTEEQVKLLGSFLTESIKHWGQEAVNFVCFICIVYFITVYFICICSHWPSIGRKVLIKIRNFWNINLWLKMFLR